MDAPLVAAVALAQGSAPKNWVRFGTPMPIVKACVRLLVPDVLAAVVADDTCIAHQYSPGRSLVDAEGANVSARAPKILAVAFELHVPVKVLEPESNDDRVDAFKEYRTPLRLIAAPLVLLFVVVCPDMDITTRTLLKSRKFCKTIGTMLTLERSAARPVVVIAFSLTYLLFAAGT
jgi:hypothetical protein